VKFVCTENFTGSIFCIMNIRTTFLVY